MLRLLPERLYQGQLMDFHMLRHHVVLAIHPSTLRHLFLENKDNLVRKSDFMEKALSPVLKDSLFINHGKTWRRRRTAISAFFKQSEVARFHPVFLQSAEELVSLWSTSGVSGSREVTHDIRMATSRVMARVLFGPDVQIEKVDALADLFSQFESARTVCPLSTLLGLPRHWEFPWGASQAAARELRSIAASLLSEKAGDGLAQDIGNELAAAGELTGDSLLNETLMLMLAGSETSANAMAWTLFLLARYPEAMRDARTQIDSVASGLDLTPDILPELTQLRAVINEAMRLYPPVFMVPRQAKEPFVFRHVEVQSGDTVAYMPWLMHRHRGLWHEPDVFCPGRF